MKIYRVYDIDWDCDDEETKSQLPKEMIVEDKKNLGNENCELSDFISDEIANLKGFTHFGCCYEEVNHLSKGDIINLVSSMKDEDLLDIFVLEKDDNILAMGVEKHRVMDGISVLLCNVYGSNCDFKCYPLEEIDKEHDDETIANVADYFFNTAKALCGDNILYLFKAV